MNALSEGAGLDGAEHVDHEAVVGGVKEAEGHAEHGDDGQQHGEGGGPGGEQHEHARHHLGTRQESHLLPGAPGEL